MVLLQANTTIGIGSGFMISLNQTKGTTGVTKNVYRNYLLTMKYYKKHRDTETIMCMPIGKCYNKYLHQILSFIDNTLDLNYQHKVNDVFKTFNYKENQKFINLILKNHLKDWTQGAIFPPIKILKDKTQYRHENQNSNTLNNMSFDTHVQLINKYILPQYNYKESKHLFSKYDNTNICNINNLYLYEYDATYNQDYQQNLSTEDVFIKGLPDNNPNINNANWHQLKDSTPIEYLVFQTPLMFFRIMANPTKDFLDTDHIWDDIWDSIPTHFQLSSMQNALLGNHQMKLCFDNTSDNNIEDTILRTINKTEELIEFEPLLPMLGTHLSLMICYDTIGNAGNIMGLHIPETKYSLMLLTNINIPLCYMTPYGLQRAHAHNTNANIFETGFLCFMDIVGVGMLFQWLEFILIAIHKLQTFTKKVDLFLDLCTYAFFCNCFTIALYIGNNLIMIYYDALDGVLRIKWICYLQKTLYDQNQGTTGSLFNTYTSIDQYLKSNKESLVQNFD